VRANFLLALLGGTLALFGPCVFGLDFPGPAPGQAQAEARAGELALGNRVIECHWSTAGGTMRLTRICDKLAGRDLALAGQELFRLTLADGRTLSGSDFQLMGEPVLEHLPAQGKAATLALHFRGRQFRARLAAPDGSLEVEWRAMLRDQGNAIRQEFAFVAPGRTVAVKEARLIEAPGAGAKVAGTVPGSPLVLGNWFLAYEHPDAQSAVADAATSSLAFNPALSPGQRFAQSAVIGVAPPGQMRRAFLYYVESERAHPYRPFLHYNAWYDICWSGLKINEAQCLGAIEVFGRELTARRGVRLASFVWDDGWDDPKTLWQPVRTNFPNGFANVLAAARRHGSTLGFWLSPFGGYGKPAEERLAMGKQQGFETGPQGFSLAGPKYSARFQETCLDFIEHSGANFFKFDGLARGVDETEAMLRLTRALRARRPDLFISITTGTWPSPFWLWHGDSTWRGGGDMGFYGPGSKREQWITYRDLETYRGVVRKGPLYPLNSLMNQGFAHARHGSASECGNAPEEIRRELRSLFAGGTCLQELYVTPTMMSAQNWDDLAEAAKWAHGHANVLVDTHWIGGDPEKLEPYGWASWTPRLGILALRNPAASPATIALDLGAAFELPSGAPRLYTLRSPWREDRAKPRLQVRAGAPHTFALAPFAVLVLEARPVLGP